MPRVLLTRPLCEGDEPEFAEPLGIERLAGYLRSHGVDDAAVFDRRLYQQERRAGIRLGSFWGDVRAYYADGAPDVVGVSIMTAADMPDALRILSRAHALWPEAQLEAGGLYVTMAPDHAARLLPKGTSLTRGEGEAPLLSRVLGIAADADSTLSPDDWAQAFRPVPERYAALGCSVNMQTSRGCPGRCSFCATPNLPLGLRRWRPRRIELVVDEIEHEAVRLLGAGLPPVFNFVDDDFGPLDRIEKLVCELDRRGLRIAFALEMRLASLIGKSDLARRLTRVHDAGLTRVFVGVESLNPHTLCLWQKSYDLEGLPAVLDACAESGIRVQTGYILWHRDQTLAGARSEVERLHRMGIYSHRAALSRLIVFAGCALAEQGAGGQGLQRMSDEAEDFYQRFSDATVAMTRDWLRAAIAEPYATAEAFLTGDEARLMQVRGELSRIDEQSYQLFLAMAS